MKRLSFLSILFICYCARASTDIAAVDQTTRPPVATVYPTDLEMETVSNWTIGRMVTFSGTLLLRLAKNLEKLGKIVIWQDPRCQGVVGLSPELRVVTFNTGSHLQKGVVDFLELLIVRAKRTENVNLDFISTITLAHSNIAKLISQKSVPTAITLDQWIFLVTVPLKIVFSDKSLELFEVMWRKELVKVLESTKSLLQVGYKRMMGNILQIAPGWAFEDTLNMGFTTTFLLYHEPPAGSSKASIMEKLVHNFLHVSNFVLHCHHFIEVVKISAEITKRFGLMIKTGLLPYIECLMKKDENTEELSIDRAIRVRIKKAQMYLNSYLESNDVPVVPDFYKWTRDIYGNLLPLFLHGIGGMTGPTWAIESVRGIYANPMILPNL